MGNGVDYFWIIALGVALVGGTIGFFIGSVIVKKKMAKEKEEDARQKALSERVAQQKLEQEWKEHSKGF